MRITMITAGIIRMQIMTMYVIIVIMRMYMKVRTTVQIEMVTMATNPTIWKIIVTRIITSKPIEGDVYKRQGQSFGGNRDKLEIE